MQVYQIIKNCSITYIDENGVDVGFALYEGDYIFIEQNSYWVSSNYQNYIYIKQSVLVKIYYNKMINFKGDYEWTWIDNINIIDPRLNVKSKDISNAYIIIDIFYNDLCKNVTVQWERNEKLKQLVEQP
jgi:hypothetical protein